VRQVLQVAFEVFSCNKNASLPVPMQYFVTGEVRKLGFRTVFFYKNAFVGFLVLLKKSSEEELQFIIALNCCCDSNFGLRLNCFLFQERRLRLVRELLVSL